ncbi:BQ2448_124 [Microbotryum intermedium]|uniref:GDP-mannose transporter n=1 Tax=Microbotryum intermedium TaxID=269621 RepID=A0A238F7K6_9BASI|nr:BQ2448_124 [Microbotryum intermedium]
MSESKGVYTLAMNDDGEIESDSKQKHDLESSLPLLDRSRHAAPPPVPSRRSSEQPFRSGTDRILNHSALPVFSYCVASILMTVVNKYVVSGSHFNMNFLLLAIQSIVCVGCVAACKHFGVISYRDWDSNDARKWFPISFLLVCVIYTGSKSLQFLTIPIYTIFKNLTIVIIAYGEVLWFGGHVTWLTLVSFGLMVVSSLVAASSDISSFLSGTPIVTKAGGVSSAGYLWMFANCFVSAGFVLAMRKRIKITNFSDWDTLRYNNLLSIPVLAFFSLLVEDWSYESLVANLFVPFRPTVSHLKALPSHLYGTRLSHSPEENRFSLLSLMAFSGAAAVGISFCTAWVIRTTSSTTFSMVGALNKLPVAASGILFFGATVSNVMGIFLGFVAGLVCELPSRFN